MAKISLNDVECFKQLQTVGLGSVIEFQKSLLTSQLLCTIESFVHGYPCVKRILSSVV